MASKHFSYDKLPVYDPAPPAYEPRRDTNTSSASFTSRRGKPSRDGAIEDIPAIGMPNLPETWINWFVRISGGIIDWSFHFTVFLLYLALNALYLWVKYKSINDLDGLCALHPHFDRVANNDGTFFFIQFWMITNMALRHDPIDRILNTPNRQRSATIATTTIIAAGGFFQSWFFEPSSFKC